jgi:hypothetical protein
MEGWMVDESKEIDAEALQATMPQTVFRGAARATLAVRINDLIIHDTKKLFGSADVRLDTLVVYGKGGGRNIKEMYQPSTFRFSGIKDNDRLPIEAPGQRIYYGQPLHFLDISVFASRDSGDSEELSTMIDSELNSDDWKTAAGSILGAATVAAPQAALIVGALSGAATLANIAYKLLDKSTGNTIGVYKTSWLQHRDRFGIGRHPEADSYRQQDLSFWYEIAVDVA